MTKVERFNKAVAFLKGEQEIKTQQDIAEAMGVNKTTVSQAVKGATSYFTDSFLRKFVGSYPKINLGWLLTGNGEMLKNTVHQEGDHNIGVISTGYNSGSIGNNGDKTLLKDKEAQIAQLLEQNKALIERVNYLTDKLLEK